MRALSCLGCLLLLASTTALAGPVYKWKDAKGVTHYADAPPKDRAYRNRTIREDVPAPTAAATPSSRCCSSPGRTGRSGQPPTNEPATSVVVRSKKPPSPSLAPPPTRPKLLPMGDAASVMKFK